MRGRESYGKTERERKGGHLLDTFEENSTSDIKTKEDILSSRKRYKSDIN